MILGLAAAMAIGFLLGCVTTVAALCELSSR
jgi:hypothetical protein